MGKYKYILKVSSKAQASRTIWSDLIVIHFVEFTSNYGFFHSSRHLLHFMDIKTIAEKKTR